MNSREVRVLANNTQCGDPNRAALMWAADTLDKYEAAVDAVIDAESCACRCGVGESCAHCDPYGPRNRLVETVITIRKASRTPFS